VSGTLSTLEVATTWDVERIRADFPVLEQTVNGKPLIYLDNSASSQVPQVVIDRGSVYIEQEHSNIHRGVHYLSQKATTAYEGAREKVKQFINARESRECIFVRGATEGINLVMHGYGRKFIGAGDEIIISAMEHHSNIVPWQQVCARTGAVLRVAPMDDRGELVMEEFERLLTPRTKMVAVAHASNALGTVNPVDRIVRMAHNVGAKVLLDGSQAVQHLRTDVRALDADFYVFTGHKIYGPTGIGILYGKEALLDAMPPFLGGGDMIRTVTFEGSTWNDLPYKFEAGTPHIAGAIGLGRAIEYFQGVGFDAVQAHEASLLEKATAALSAIDGVRLIGTAREKVAVVSFIIDGVHPHDVGTIVDREGVAIRTGHHCAQPVMDRLGIPATARASFAVYNTLEEIDVLAAAVARARKLLG